MNKRHRTLALSAVTALLLCLPVAGQAQAEETTVTKEPQEADIYPEMRREEVDEQTVRDMQIKSWIDDALASEEDFPAARIDVEVDNGVVRLRGEVPDEEARERAGRIARDTQYVSEVRNELKIADDEDSGG